MRGRLGVWTLCLVALCALSCGHSTRLNPSGEQPEPSAGGGGAADAGDRDGAAGSDAGSDCTIALGTGADAGAPSNTITGHVAYYDVPYENALVLVGERSVRTAADGSFTIEAPLPYDATVVFEQQKVVLRYEGLTRTDPLLDCTSCPTGNVPRHTAALSGVLDAAGMAPDGGAAADHVQPLIGLSAGALVAAPNISSPESYSIEFTWVGPPEVDARVVLVTISPVAPPADPTGQVIGSAELNVKLSDGAVLTQNVTAPEVQSVAYAPNLSGPAVFWPPHEQADPPFTLYYSWLSLDSPGRGPEGIFSLGMLPGAPLMQAPELANSVLTYWSAYCPVPTCERRSVSTIRYRPALGAAPADLTFADELQVSTDGDDYVVEAEPGSVQTVSFSVSGWQVRLFTPNTRIRPPSYLHGCTIAPYDSIEIDSNPGKIDDRVAATRPAPPLLEYVRTRYSELGPL